MTYSIAAQPGTYAGEHFDSALERRWAFFFDKLGLDWRREPFAVRHGAGRATIYNVVASPDFFLPLLSIIVECKPTWQMALAYLPKLQQVASVTGLPVMVTAGRPGFYKSSADFPALPNHFLTVVEGRQVWATAMACPACKDGAGVLIATPDDTIRRWISGCQCVTATSIDRADEIMALLGRERRVEAAYQAAFDWIPTTEEARA